MYRVILTKRAKNQLSKLDSEIQSRIISVLMRIRIRPRKYVEKLAVYDNYRLRVGKYRVIMDIVDRDLVILVIKVGHRKDIYT